MSLSRRDFVKSASAAAALTALGSRADALDSTSVFARTHAVGAADYHDLAMRALDAAKGAGAQYSDVRIAQYRSQSVQTRERRVQGLSDTETVGIGVRALVNGAWGFAATANLTTDAVAAIAEGRRPGQGQSRRAVSGQLCSRPMARRRRASGRRRSRSIRSPCRSPTRSRCCSPRTPRRSRSRRALRQVVDEFSARGEDLREQRRLVHRADHLSLLAHVTVTAVSEDRSDFQTRAANDVAPRGLGYEHVRDADLVDNAPRWADEAVQKLSAKPVDVGRYDLVLHPTHLWLTIHESRRASDRARSRDGLRGQLRRHELRRATGQGARPAHATAPTHEHSGRPHPGRLALRVRMGRRRREARHVRHHQERHVRRLPDHARAGAVARWWYYKKIGKPMRSHGCSYAQSWADVQFQRMPNVSLLPGEKDHVWEDLIAATDNGIAIIGDGSFSIDQQRYNAQFGGQVFYEIKGGKIVGMLKDVAYQIRTPEFWGAMDMIGGQRSYLPRWRLRRRARDSRPGQRGQPRLRPVALPPGQRHQHGTDGVSRTSILGDRGRPALSLARECQAIAKNAPCRSRRRTRRACSSTARTQQHALRRKSDLDRATPSTPSSPSSANLENAAARLRAISSTTTSQSRRHDVRTRREAQP